MRIDSRAGRAVQKISASPVFAKVAPAIIPRLDRLVHRLTGGRRVLSKGLLPTVMLTTTGARSGEPRDVPLGCIRHEGALYVVGSNFGRERHPAWTGNLLPEVDRTRFVSGIAPIRRDSRHKMVVARSVRVVEGGTVTGPGDGRLAFICAMPIELTPLKKRLSLTKTSINGVKVHTGMLGGRPVVAIVSGMGTKLATDATERLLDAVSVGRVVVVGITGAVENETLIGTLVMPEVVVDAATREEFRPHPMGVVARAGKMWTTDVLLTDLDVIADLRAEGVVSLDMETAAIARVCEARGVPWSVFRVISDRATDGTIDEDVFHLSHPDGRAVARYFLRHPGRIPRMLRLAKGARLATERAADAAVTACGAVA